MTHLLRNGAVFGAARREMQTPPLDLDRNDGLSNRNFAHPKTVTAAERAAFPTNSTSSNHSVQRWANFIAGFSVEFVESALRSVRAPARVLDPFLGTGTTAVAARQMGMEVVGYESHPLFAELAICKTTKWTVEDLDEVAQTLGSRGEPRRLSPPASKFLEKLFPQDGLDRLLEASLRIDSLDPRLRQLAIAILLQAAERVCGSKTDGIYKAPTSRKRSFVFGDALSSVVAMFREDIESSAYERFADGPATKVVRASSTDMGGLDDGSVSAVVTSPPYLNNFDFAEMTRMQLYLLGWAASWADITATVRQFQITNTTTALKGRKTDAYQDECLLRLPESLRPELSKIKSALTAQRKVRKGKKEYDFLVYPYYRQIQDVINELHRVMADGAPVHWIVSDAALYGQYIETQEHTAALLRKAGFADVRVMRLRHRGHRWKLEKRDGAPGRLGEYHILGVRR